MPSPTIARPPIRVPFYYGWAIVGVAGLALFFSGPGQTYSVSVFIDPLIAEFGWSRSLVSGLYSSATLAAGLCMAFVGRLVDARGPRAVLTTIAVLFGLACLFMSIVGNPAMLFAGFFLIRLLGQGSLTLVPFSLVPQWFIAMRGRALALVAIGGAISSAALPYINLAIIQTFDWRTVWHIWAALLILILAPIAWTFTRTRPEDIGLLPDNAQPQTGSNEGEDPTADEPAWSPRQLIRLPLFWVLLAITAIPSMVGTGLTFHHLSILTSNGVSAAAAASVFTIMAVTALACTPLAGYLADRWPTRYMLAVSLLLVAVSTIWVEWTNSAGMIIALGILRGLSHGFFQITNGVVWPHYFGRRHLASIRGITTSAMVLSSAMGPLPFGLAYDIFGGYREVVLLMTLITLAGTLVSFGVRGPKRKPAAPAGMTT